MRQRADLYQGIASSPFPPEVVDVLTAPLNEEDVEIKLDGLLFLPEIKYRRILNKAFGPGGWALMPMGDILHFQVTDTITTCCCSSTGGHCCILHWRSLLHAPLEVTAAYSTGGHCCILHWRSLLHAPLEVTAAYSTGDHCCILHWRSLLHTPLEVAVYSTGDCYILWCCITNCSCWWHVHVFGVAEEPSLAKVWC